ncbi:sulfite exporter TauE/SafE family protein [Paenarthrobacter sp. MSM-2-10-13]|uniref:sulfite exporter TauE/SafE family protein n=1 Tax=Paenarthrobacter sp. MSM-2-10-13 TaxID=2717318 RepID=UPI00142397ED|nr:sulfite exporter TauE/SafE family protein [Paenarthrobacter sp. MSM-2-10-13]NHW45936.1 sulfite exporter TauE/SafE family protein [Paenarthrobacter sp. MSM-2-10-13]
MSETVETETKSKPWQWLGEWMRDEKFWRDVASRTLAGALVVAMGYLVAVANGLLAVPSVAQIFVGVVFIALGVGIFWLFVAKYLRWIAPLVNRISRPWGDILDTLIKLVVIGLSVWMLIAGILSFRP